MTQRLEFNLFIFLFLTIIFISLSISNDIPKDNESINFVLTSISFESLTPLLEAEYENKRKLL